MPIVDIYKIFNHHLVDDIQQKLCRPHKWYIFCWTIIPCLCYLKNCPHNRDISATLWLTWHQISCFSTMQLPHMYQQVWYLMRGINGEKLGLKYLNVGKMLMISSLCILKCKSYLRSKTHGERDYKKFKKSIWICRLQNDDHICNQALMC